MVSDLDSVLIAIVCEAFSRRIVLAVLIEYRDVAFLKHRATEVRGEGEDVVRTIRLKFSVRALPRDTLIVLLHKATEKIEVEDG